MADGDGNVVAATQTINSLFGSRATVPGTGMLLNNTMALFDPHPGHALSVAPGKRMTSSMAPTIVFREGRPHLALGLPGGVRIFTSVLQALVNVIDHGMSLQEAVEAPRIWTQGQELEVEAAVPEGVRAGLAARGPRRGAGAARRRRHVRHRLGARRLAHRRRVLARRRHAGRPRRRPRAPRHPMLIVLMLTLALTFASGCAQPDWIQQTLVTADVTGTWTGTSTRGGGGSTTGFEAQLELVQQGAKVKGEFRVVGAGLSGALGIRSGSIDGSVGGMYPLFSSPPALSPAR